MRDVVDTTCRNRLRGFKRQANQLKSQQKETDNRGSSIRNTAPWIGDRCEAFCIGRVLRVCTPASCGERTPHTLGCVHQVYVTMAQWAGPGGGIPPPALLLTKLTSAAPASFLTSSRGRANNLSVLSQTNHCAVPLHCGVVALWGRAFC